MPRSWPGTATSPSNWPTGGNRLVFSNGLLLLGIFSCVLIVIFRGSTHALIPLYAVGVFLSFALVFKTGAIVTAVP